MKYRRVDDVDVYFYNTLTEVSRSRELFKYLDENEILRSKAFYFKKDKEHFIVRRGILRELLSSFLLMEPKDITFSYNSYGKPFVIDRINTNSINFNVSHSGDHFVIVVSKNKELGIDIEEVKNIDGFNSIAKSNFSSFEFSMICRGKTLNDQLLLFYKTWTQKEAVVKSIGIGLNIDLDQWSVEYDKENYELQLLNYNIEIFYLEIYFGYQICLAINKPDCN